MEEGGTPTRAVEDVIEQDGCLWCQLPLSEGWIQRVMAADGNGKFHEFGMHLRCWREMMRIRHRSGRDRDGRYPL